MRFDGPRPIIVWCVCDHCLVRVGLRAWQCELSGLAASGWALLRCLLGRLGARARRCALWAGWGWSMARLCRCARMSRIWLGVAGQRSGWESGVACGAQAGLAWQGSGRRAMSGDGHRGEGSARLLGTQLCCAVLLVLTLSCPWGESVRGAACAPLLFACVRAGHLVLW